MAKCDKEGCKELAVSILSVGSLGRNDTLCSNHLQVAKTLLDSQLTPYQLTGVEYSYSKEEALSKDLDDHADEISELRAQLADVRAENAELHHRIVQQLEEERTSLIDQLEALRAENERLKVGSEQRVE